MINKEFVEECIAHLRNLAEKREARSEARGDYNENVATGFELAAIEIEARLRKVPPGAETPNINHQQFIEQLEFILAESRAQQERGVGFKEIRDANMRRLPDFPGHDEEWSPAEWGNALAGETGELCNKLKKIRRGEAIPIKDIADEIADVVLYADLVAAQFDIDLEAAVVSKFNEVSDRYNFKEHRL